MEMLLTLTLAGSVLALLLLALRYLILRRMPSTVYYYAWLLVLLRFALPLPGLIPTASAAEAPAPAAVNAPLPETETELFLPMSPGLGFIPASDMSPADAAAEEEAAPALSETVLPAAPAREKLSVDWRSPRLWLGLWAAGTALCFGFTLASYLRFTVGLRRSLRRPDRLTRAVYASIPGRKPALFRSPAIRTPLMYGIFAPKIVLPEREYDEELLLNILRHELTHYRRFDTLYKWLTAAVLSAHWFNPISWLIRRELNRACELSCDEMLLRSMTRGEKQSYGNTLLSMAASSALPAGVVATTFATEKRDLKERLEQIMHYKKSGARILAAVLALALLAGCGMAAGPQAQKEEASAAPLDTRDGVRVSTVDELLAAIAPDTTILLEPGEYDLSAAADYATDSGKEYYTWGNIYSDSTQNAELLIRNVDNLTILGDGLDTTTVAAIPRYANVLRFENCSGLTLSGFTAGHTREPGFCSGGVLRLENCAGTTVDACGLFGCGTVGVWASGCSDLTVKNSRIYECSWEAVDVGHCRNVRIENNEIYRHGVREGQGNAASLLLASYTEGFTVYNNRIYNSAAEYMLNLQYTRQAVFLSNEIYGNRIVGSMMNFEQYPAVIDGCSFHDNECRTWLPNRKLNPVSVDGSLLSDEDLANMQLRDLDPATAVTPEPAGVPETVSPGQQITVTNVDDFLKAIGPDRTIVLDGELFDLSAASDYGAFGGEYYYWQQSYDGPELVIHGVSGLTIHPRADYAEATTLAAVPRYANVLNFKECSDIQLIGFTLGHTKEPGSCSGGVVNLEDCGNVRVDGCRLYGCGVLGLQTARCATLQVWNTEIFECSQGAGQFFQTDGIDFRRCNIHDVPSPALVFRECGDKTWDGDAFTGLNSMFDVDENGALVEVVYERPEEQEYHGAVEDLVNPFSEMPPEPLTADSPIYQFAASVQRDFDEWNWPALADKIAFPMQLFDDGYSYVIYSREDFLDMVPQGDFEGVLFSKEYCERIAKAGNSEYGQTVIGNTILDHMIAVMNFGDPMTEDTFRIRAISLKTPLWPGRPFDPATDALPYDAPPVPPTPQP